MKKTIIATIVAFMTGGTMVADSSYYVQPIPQVQQVEQQQPQRKTRKMVCSVSAYSASVEECGKSDGITASGEKAIEGKTIAMENVPFYTKVIINGQEYEVHDRFGHGKDGYIDIYMDNKADCWEWGRQEIEVEIIEN